MKHMRTHSFPNLQWLTFCHTLFLGCACLGDSRGLTLQIGDTEIVLDKEWERLEQPENFVVQKRAWNAKGNIALSAGALKTDLTFQQYVALGIYGLSQGPDKALELGTKLTAKLAHIPVTEVEKAVQSRI